jgi:hypothetical protein
MKHFTIALCALALGAAAVGCSNDPTVENGGTTTNGANITFIQLGREGRPGIKELFLPYAAHDAFNRQSPSTETATLAPAITTFMTGAPANRSAAVAAYVSSLLSSDALVANLGSSATHASYLGYETNAGIQSDCTGLAPTNFGGRGLNDDVVNATLGLVFGNYATTANPTVVASPGPAGALAPDDGKEQNGSGGTPNLTNQEVSCSTKGFTLGAFPYLAPPV